MNPLPQDLAGELLPCPFCGGKPITHRNSGISKWAVSCTRCDCKPMHCIADTEADAITAWNTRTPQQVAAGDGELDYTPTGALGLPAWQYDLRVTAAALRLTDNTLTPEFRGHVADLLGRLQSAIAALSSTPPPKRLGDDGLVERDDAVAALATINDDDRRTANALFIFMDPLKPDPVAVAQVIANYRAAISALAPTCPSCGGLNTSCPDGCGRDPLTGELNGTRLERGDHLGETNNG